MELGWCRAASHWFTAHPRIGVERAIEGDAARGTLDAEGQVVPIGPWSTRRHQSNGGIAGRQLSMRVGEGGGSVRHTVLDDQAERPYALVEPHVRVQKARLLHGEVVTDGYITL